MLCVFAKYDCTLGGDSVTVSIYPFKVLQANEFRGLHDDTSLAEKIEKKPIKLNIPKSNIYIVLCNIAGHVRKGTEDNYIQYI